MAKLTSVFNKESVKSERRPKRTTKWIHYTKLRSSKYQYCDAREKEEIETLADAIEAIGEVLENLLIRKVDSDEYEILGGHKRCAACKLLVEERGKDAYAFLPCDEKKESEARSHFMVLASNIHHIETPYEKMHKLTTMKNLIENYPEEFPDVQSGRMVERLAKMCGMKKTTVGEYLSIAKNLGEEAMEAFKEGDIEKSAAVTLAGMPKETQRHALKQGITADTALKEYKKENLEPSGKEMLLAYRYLGIGKYDGPDRKKVVERISSQYRNAGIHMNGFDFDGKGKQLKINGKTITWNRFVHLLNEYIPYQPSSDGFAPNGGGKDMEGQLAGQMEIVNTDMEIAEKASEPDPGVGQEQGEGKEEAGLPEREIVIDELPHHDMRICFCTYGQADTLFLININYPGNIGAAWFGYIPSSEYGFNLSDSDKDANRRKLSAGIRDEAACSMVNDRVWDMFRREK